MPVKGPASVWLLGLSTARMELVELHVPFDLSRTVKVHAA